MQGQEGHYAEIEACEKLLKYATDDSERVVVAKEIADLKTDLHIFGKPFPGNDLKVGYK